MWCQSLNPIIWAVICWQSESLMSGIKSESSFFRTFEARFARAT